VEFCRAHPCLLTEWERQFLDSIAGHLMRGSLTEKQTGVLRRLYLTIKHTVKG
jgi:hypothetical protein